MGLLLIFSFFLDGWLCACFCVVGQVVFDFFWGVVWGPDVSLLLEFHWITGFYDAVCRLCVCDVFASWGFFGVGGIV